MGARIHRRRSTAGRTRADRAAAGGMCSVGRGRLLALAAVATLFALACFAAQADAFVYWSNDDGSIGRANLDGSGAETLISVSETGAYLPFGIAVDAQHIYWDDSSNGTIGRANLDGSHVNDSFITAVAHSAPEGVAVDGQYIYWDNTNTDTIGRANLDGSGVNESFITGGDAPDALAVDGQYIYWANFGSDTVGRANLNGSDVNNSFITDPPSVVSGVAVNGQYVYWSSRAAGTIGRANLDGSNIQHIASNQESPLGLAVDNQYVYWANEGGSLAGTTSIGRESLTGPQIPTSYFISGIAPTAVAVDALPLAPSASITTPTNGAIHVRSDGQFELHLQRGRRRQRDLDLS
jgi:virginiamycin B lyase